MAIKKGDFISLTFVGKLKETGQIFDLTDEALAKKEKIHNPQANYGDKTICVGEHQVVRGLDAFLVGKDLNKKYSVELTPEEAFGKKDARLLKLVPASTFKKQQIKPFPGLQLNMDGKLGVVRTVSGGRIIVDFNHPLAGRDIVYEFTIKKEVKDMGEQLQCYLDFLFNDKVDCSVKEGKAVIKTTVPEQVQDSLKKQLKKLIPGLKDVQFGTKQKEEKKQPLKHK